MTRYFQLLVLTVFLAMTAGDTLSQDKSQAKQGSDETGEITLERLFPKESFFGPQSRGAAFSQDGRFAAYLYRTLDERRHGNDLWVYDFQTGETTRITNLALMTKFQRSARIVKQDRLAKHRKAEKSRQDDTATGETSEESKQDGKQGAAGKDQDKASAEGDDKEMTAEQILEENRIVNSVDKKDADDKFAPRYNGISGFEWHPQDHSMLVFSEGDIYRIADIEKPELVRLTRTETNESQVEFLPDGSGYTYNVDNAVYRLRFDSHLVEQLNPELGTGKSLSNYSLSPDGNKLVLVGRSSGGGSSDGRKVDIIRYRDRFAKADSVSRTVSDDETKPSDVFVYLYDLAKIGGEDSELLEVFHTTIDDPRDVISRPEWSLDSERVTFCFFNQENKEIEIRVGGFPDEKEHKQLLAAAEKEATAKRNEAAAKAKKDEEENGERRGRRGVSNEPPLIVKFEAQPVYRFKHDGGPTTPSMVSPDWAADSKHVVFISEQSGFRHVHVLDTVYESVRQLTSGHYEVYPLDMSEDHKTLFVTSTKDSSARQMVYSIDIESGDMKRISREDGVYSSIGVSDNGERMLSNFVTFGKLTELICQDGDKVKTITDSHPKEAVELTRWMPEFFEYENRHGHTIHGTVFTPDGWSEKTKDKYPLLIYVYGGPLGTTKSVVDGSYRSDSYFFGGYMAKKHGYVAVVIDPRGQSGYGGLFEKANYEQVGKPQVEDLVDGVKYLVENYHADDQRVALHGWSFGGFQTQMCLYTEPDVFQVGMAGAGPTEWENYNAWYTTGTVGPSKTGSPDQKKYSLRPLAKGLQGQLLLIHGMEDTNVLFQDTVAIYRELLKAGKEAHVELFLDPTGGHGLGGDVKTLNKMRKYEEFLLRTIGDHAADSKQATRR